MQHAFRILALAVWCAGTGACIGPPATRLGLDRLKSLAEGLDRHPPGFNLDPVREQAFLDLDKFFEATVRPGQPFDLSKGPNEIWRWIDRRLLRALDEAEAPLRNPDELTVWQMYNMGLLCRVGDTVIGLDIIAVPGASPQFARRVAALVDALLVTHGHPDHFDRNLVQATLAAGKPVFLPGLLATNWDAQPNLHPIAEPEMAEVLGTRIAARRGFHVWADAQADAHMVYYELTFSSGHALIFCGDLDYTRALEKTAAQAIDLLVIPWRSPNARYEPGDPQQIAERPAAVQIALDRIQPRHLLYSHYGELAHVSDGIPASYEIAAGLKRVVKTPSEWMFWGERLTLPAQP